MTFSFLKSLSLSHTLTYSQMNVRTAYIKLHTCVHAKSLHWYLTLCDPMDCSLPASSVHGFLQATVLELVATILGWNPRFLCLKLAGGFFTSSATWETRKVACACVLSQFSGVWLFATL